jgi:hypothetical protein
MIGTKSIGICTSNTMKIQLRVYKANIIIISSNITCSRHDIAEKLRFGLKQHSLTHSLYVMLCYVVMRCDTLCYAMLWYVRCLLILYKLVLLIYNFLGPCMCRFSFGKTWTEFPIDTIICNTS